jgi:mRNA interferase MazF
MNPYPGEVWLADLGLAAKTRPVVFVSCYDSDPPRALVIYVPLTTQYRASPDEVALPRLAFLDSRLIRERARARLYPDLRLERKLGKVSNDVLGRIKAAMTVALDL